MYHISSTLYLDIIDENIDYSFLKYMIEKKVIKSFYIVRHFDTLPHYHIYFEFYSKKVYEENYELFSSYGFTFKKSNFYDWFTYFYDYTPVFSADIFGTEYKNIMSKILDK